MKRDKFWSSYLGNTIYDSAKSTPLRPDNYARNVRTISHTSIPFTLIVVHDEHHISLILLVFFTPFASSISPLWLMTSTALNGTQRHSRTSQSFSAQRSALMPILVPILTPILASILVPMLAPILVLNLVPILCHATLPQAGHDDLFAGYNVS
ncbi:hypothetical protein P692DRAFT_20877754 [Suillus brevipes Sb2]|nr:hypothetical protein P692DRAFT_20877754 [Suillus brevipes Sb2]